MFVSRYGGTKKVQLLPQVQPEAPDARDPSGPGPGRPRPPAGRPQPGPPAPGRPRPPGPQACHGRPPSHGPSLPAPAGRPTGAVFRFILGSICAPIRGSKHVIFIEFIMFFAYLAAPATDKNKSMAGPIYGQKKTSPHPTQPGRPASDHRPTGWAPPAAAGWAGPPALAAADSPPTRPHEPAADSGPHPSGQAVK